MSEPGMDNREASAGANELINIGEFFERFFSSEPQLEETWSRFRGNDFDNIKKTGQPLINSFGGDPKIQWQVELGEGVIASEYRPSTRSGFRSSGGRSTQGV